MWEIKKILKKKTFKNILDLNIDKKFKNILDLKIFKRNLSLIATLNLISANKYGAQVPRQLCSELFSSVSVNLNLEIYRKTLGWPHYWHWRKSKLKPKLGPGTQILQIFPLLKRNFSTLSVQNQFISNCKTKFRI